MSKLASEIDITVTITVHREGIILHHTLQSALGAIRQLPDDVQCEIMIHADNPNAATSDYIARIADYIPSSVPHQVFINQFGNPGASRQFCTEHARGDYIAFIDGDDLMSDNWLAAAYSTLTASTRQCVAHSEYTVEFGATNSIVKKFGAIDKATDTLLSVWAGRWNAIIFAPTALIKQLGYPEAGSGYGFEDWEMSCKLIAAGVENVVVPETAM